MAAQIDAAGQRTVFDDCPADHPSAGRLKSTVNPAGKARPLTDNTRGQQLAAWGKRITLWPTNTTSSAR